MFKIDLAVLYLSVGLGANLAAVPLAAEPAPAVQDAAEKRAPVDIPALEALRDGSMKKLNFHSEPKDVSQERFTDAGGAEHQLSDWKGRPVLVNFWATWCAPCRTEMPLLDALQERFGGDGFEVITIATARSAPGGVDKFFEEAEIAHLPKFFDMDQSLARDMGVLGLPVTLLLDADGHEIARMQGDAEWFGASAQAIISQLTE